MDIEEASLAAEAAAADIAAEITDGGSVFRGFAVADACVDGGGYGGG